MTSRLRVLFAGTPDVAVPTLQTLLAHHDVAAVLTRPPARRRRRGGEEPSPVALAAQEAGVEVWEWPTLRTPEAVEAVAALDLDAAVVVAYGSLVPASMLDLPRFGWLNLHFSLLPAWRGAAPVQWAVRRGDEITGASVFRLTAGLDEGPVFGTMTETIRPRDTSGDLLARLSTAGVPLVMEVLAALEAGRAVPQEQSSDGVSLAPRIDVAEAEVEWNQPALVIDRFVRSMTPSPGAWTQLRGARVKLGPIRLGSGPDLPDVLEPGELQVTRSGVFVGTASAPVELGELAPAGKSWMPADAWARGARLSAGERFGA